ncbi:MAG: DUF1028 domain-containing protein [Verrucomicrobia bacterium]|nr:DUF1028 domain-containing protein [Verrucomicrobiota bacterium]
MILPQRTQSSAKRNSFLRRFAFLAAILCLSLSSGCRNGAVRTPRPATPVATYSIVAFDPKTGDLGVAVQSKFFGVGSVVPWAKAKVGAVATQAYANTTYGPEGLKQLESRRAPQKIIERLTSRDKERDSRQVAVIDAKGRAAAFTGTNCFAWAGHFVGTNFSVQGNILAGEQVIRAMAEAFSTAQQQPDSELADWLMAALDAAEKAGGDRRGRQSAALLVVRDQGGYGDFNDRYVDLRVEDNAEPIQELARLLQLHRRFTGRVKDAGGGR